MGPDRTQVLTPAALDHPAAPPLAEPSDLSATAGSAAAPRTAFAPDLSFLADIEDELNSPSQGPAKPFTSLHDAAEKYGLESLRPGAVEVWYLRPEHRLLAHDPALIEVGKLETTHALLGKVHGGGHQEQVWHELQGEAWSQRGEARDMIMGRGLGHTSMSVGDVLVYPGSGAKIVDNFGFITR